MKNLFAAIAIAGILIGAPQAVFSQQQKPLQIMTAFKWAGLSEKEKTFYVMGVLEGWGFDLYGQQHPDLEILIECINGEGIEHIKNMTESIMVLEGGQLPAPWPVSKAMGGVCKKYREKKRK